MSAPADVVLQHYGFTPEAFSQYLKKVLGITEQQYY
jgi:hypothetical protein